MIYLNSIRKYFLLLFFLVSLSNIAAQNKSYVEENYFYGEVPFWNDFIKHSTYDEFWQSRNTLNYFDNVTPAVMTVGGWYDYEDLYGSLNTYKTIKEKMKIVTILWL
jgi:predicted acyl esterase